MKKIKFALGISLFILSSTPICSASNIMDDFYVRVDGGISVASNKVGDSNDPLLKGSKFKDTGVYGVGFGYRFNNYLRTDITAQYRELTYSGSLADHSLKNTSKNGTAFLNFYLDGRNRTIFTPYLTCGLGYSKTKAGNGNYVNPSSTRLYPGKSSNAIAWNIGLGSKIQVSKNVDFDLAYKYVGLGKVGFSKADTHLAGKPFDLRNHEATIGFAYNF